MASKRELRVEVSGDSTSAQKAFKSLGDEGEKTQGRMSRVGDGLKNVMAAGIAGVGVAVGAVGQELYSLGVKLEAMDVKSRTVFGDQIGTVQKWAAANANAMGVTRREAVGLAANFADLLVPMGMTREQAATMSTEVIGLSGALSVWSNGQKSAAEVADILQAAMLGETDGLKGLGISISAADVETRLAANGQGELEGKAREAAEAVAVQQLIMEKSQDAQHAFADNTHTAAERNAELRAKVDELKDAVATRLQPALQSVATWTVEEGIPAIDAFVHDFETGVDRIVEKYHQLQNSGFGKWLGDLKDDIRDTFGDPFNKDKPKAPAIGGGPWTSVTKKPTAFHSGGMVQTAMPGGEGLALLQDGETVLPPGVRPTSVNIASGAVQVNVNVSGSQLTEFELARAVRSGTSDATEKLLAAVRAGQRPA